jgi:copper chaperone
MSCCHCTATIRKSVEAADGNAVVATDLATREVTVETTLDTATVVAILRTAGYEANPR